jgi:hypothetical protein
MDDLGQELVTLLQFLLPGFLAAWVYYGLTSFALPSQFERVVQALIFTLLVQPLAFISKFVLLWAGKYWMLLPWSEKAELSTSVVCAFLLGTVFAALTNNDKFHALMRALKVTRETSYPSEWYGAFCNHVTFVVLHLSGSRRIYGWPIEWPSESGNGHFLLEQASWLDKDNKEIPITNVSHVLIAATEIELVEFMDLNWRSNGKEGIESATPSTTGPV